MSNFDKELFYSLCNKYNVELCDKHNSPMLKIGDEIRKVKKEDVKNILNDKYAAEQFAKEFTGAKVKKVEMRLL